VGEAQPQHALGRVDPHRPERPHGIEVPAPAMIP
jgi:hypothetical protein